MFRFFILFIIGFAIFATIIASAQDADRSCSTLVQTVTATLHNDATSIPFNVPSDIIEIIDIESLHLSGMDIITNESGVALMRVQANLPGQNVTFVIFGDVDVQAVPTSIDDKYKNEFAVARSCDSSNVYANSLCSKQQNHSIHKQGKIA